jgi:Glycosyltransferase family 9 (heptosyltransferase)
VRAYSDMNPWAVLGPAAFRGGRAFTRRERAPLGRALPYRRACGESPPVTGLADRAARDGWEVDLGEGGLGDVLLGLALARALTEATGRYDVEYTGPRPDLLRRCSLAVRAQSACGRHLVRASGPEPMVFPTVPEHPPTWLDMLDDKRVEVHAALPMRYYLCAEQDLGVRLPASHAPAPVFPSVQDAQPFHVVFVAATSWPDRKDYGYNGFAAIAAALAERHTAPWRFTLIARTSAAAPATMTAPMEVLSEISAADCVDVFASAEVVIGNDTGLTHLAALTCRPDGTSPDVIGLYSRHAHTKWATGADHHHAIATPFSQMLAAADRCPVRDRLDDSVWSESARLAGIPAHLITETAARIVGWR